MANDRIKTIFDDGKMKFTAKPVEQGCRPPTLQFGTYANNPQLTVFTNADNGSGVSVIGAGYDPVTFYELLSAVEWLATEAPNGARGTLDTLTEIPKDKRTDPKQKLEVRASTQVGRDENGKIWISVQDARNQNAPKIRFYFQTNYYHKWRWDGVRVDPADNSQRTALSWVALMRNMVAVFLPNNPNAAGDVERSKMRWAEKSGKGGNGGGNRGYNNNGGGNKQYGNNGGGKSYGGNGGGNGGGGSRSYGAGNSDSGDGYSDDFEEE